MQKTSVTFLLDRTGSMESIKQDTIGSFNAYLEGLQTGDGSEDIEFSLVQFDSTSVDKVHLNKPVKDIPKLDDKSFIPRDMTPLIDASYVTIKAVEKAVEGTDKKVVICIQTDGEDNVPNQQHTWDELAALVKEKRALGWQFNFMGVGIDAYNQSAKMGISRGSTISATMDSAEMASGYRSMSSNTRSFAAGQSVNTDFSDMQKLSAGDYTVKGASKAPPVSQPAPAPKAKAKLVDDLDLTK